MALDLELEWQEPGWQRVMDGLPRGSVIPAERFSPCWARWMRPRPWRRR